MSSRDFQASQIRLNKIIASGSDDSQPTIMIYSASDATNYEGAVAGDLLTNVGSDVFLFVDGESSVAGGTRSGVSLFNGDLVVSGTLYAEKLVAEVDSLTPSDHYVSGNLYVGTPGVGSDVTFYGDDASAGGAHWDADWAEHGGLLLGVNNHGVDFKAFGESSGRYVEWDQSGDVFHIKGHMSHSVGGAHFDLGVSSAGFRIQDAGRQFFGAYPITDQVMILSGGAQASTDEAAGPDVAFYVSGTIDSQGTAVRGTSLFGGDLHISGNLSLAGSGPYTAGDGLDLTGTAFSTDLKSGGGLKIDSTELAVEPGDFAGTGLEDDGSDNLRINDSVVATISGSAFRGHIGITGSLNVGVAGTGADVIFYGQDTDTEGVRWVAGAAGGHGALYLGKSDHGVDLVAHGETAGKYLHWGQAADMLTVDGVLTQQGGNATFNEAAGAYDFRVETNTKPNAILVSGSSDQVLILSGGAAASANEAAGSDVNFYVSGSTGNKDSVTHKGTSVFGGDVVISGSLTDAQGNPIAGAGGGASNIGWATGSAGFVAGGGAGPAGWISTTGSLAVSGSIWLGNATHGIIYGDQDDSGQTLFALSTNKTSMQAGGTGGAPVGTIEITAGSEVAGKTLVKLGGNLFRGTINENVLILSGGAATSTDESAGLDVAFYVSGTVGGKDVTTGDNIHGVSVFGGDVVISGSLTDGAGSPITGGGGSETVGWFSGSSATLGEMGASPDWISTSGSLAISGSIHVDRIYLNSGSSGIINNIDDDLIIFTSGTTDNIRFKTHFNEGSSQDRMMIYKNGHVGIGNFDGINAPPADLFTVSGSTSNTARITVRGGGILGKSAEIRLRNFQGSNRRIEAYMLTVSGASGGEFYKRIVNCPQDDTFSGFLLHGRRDQDNSAGTNIPIDMHIGVDDDGTIFPVISIVSGSSNELSKNTGSGLQVMILSGTNPKGASGNSADPQTFKDTAFFVSGSIGSKDSSTRGVSVFGGDVVISGTLHGGSPLKIGTDARLAASAGATQYLNFGATDGQSGYGIRSDGSSIELKGSGDPSWNAISSGSTGVIVKSGSTSISSTTTLNLDLLGSIVNLGSGEVAVTGTIGTSNVESYSGGLFSSFDTTTPIGHAVNKINEVLKYLSPSPAPDLGNIGTDNKGVDAKIAFEGRAGSTSVSAIGGLTDVANSGSYQVTTASNDIRMGVFNNSTVVSGNLNSGTAANTFSNGILNYSGSTFGEANFGSLILEVNGTTIKTVDLTVGSVGAGLPGFGSDSQLNGDDSGFTELSQTGSAYQANGQTFGLFQNRTGKFQVDPDSQRNGWNYARVTHTVGSTTKTTNYVEWVVDPSGSNNIAVIDPAINSAAIHLFGGGDVWISGIQYATQATGIYSASIENYYDNVYTNETIAFNTTGCTIANHAIPNPTGSSSSPWSERVETTGSFITNAGLAPGDTIAISLSVPHIFKSNVSNTGSITSDPFLIYSSSYGGTTLFEDFNREYGRILSGAYNAASDVPAVGNWDSTGSLSAVGNALGGLQFYDGTLVSPRNTLDGLSGDPGDFRSFDDVGGGGTPNFGDEYSFDGNPNYSNVTGVRSFFRAFANSTGVAARDFDITITGSSTTIVGSGTPLDSSKVRIFAKIPEQTGWLDLATAFAYNTGSDYDGGRIGNLDATIDAAGVINHFSFGTSSIANTAAIVLKIEADSYWSGSLNDITINFPAVGVSAVTEATDIRDISCSDAGVAGKLSFGTSNNFGPAIVAGSGSLAAVDRDGLYTVSSAGSSPSDLRRGIFNGTVDINGVVNDDTSASGNAFAANSFGMALTGTLVLDVNNIVIREVDLYNFTSGNSVNGNGTGFTSISAATVGEDSDNLPDYRKWYRTANWNIDTEDQITGSNYARVVHSRSLGDVQTTNYIEWVNDPPAGNIMGIDGVGFFPTFSDDVYYYQSGVKYFSGSPFSFFAYRVTQGYSNVYSSLSDALKLTSTTNITVNRMDITGSGVTDTGTNAVEVGFPALTGTGGQGLPIHVTASISFTQSESLPGIWGSSAHGVTGSAFAAHPLDNDVTSTLIKKAPLLVLNGVVAGTTNINTREDFGKEDFRFRSGSFANQSSTGSLAWDSEQSLESGGTGYNTGLLIYNAHLMSPKSSNGPASGDFRDTSDGGTYTAPTSNVNYSTLTHTTRDYYRPFKNNTTSDQADVTITLYGDAVLTPRSGAGAGSIGATKNFFMDVKIPGKTGWMDAAKAAAGGTSDGDGALSGDRDTVVDGSGAGNITDFQTEFIAGTVSSGGPEHFLIRIVADKAWTGYINKIVVSYV